MSHFPQRSTIIRWILMNRLEAVHFGPIPWVQQWYKCRAECRVQMHSSSLDYEEIVRPRLEAVLMISPV